MRFSKNTNTRIDLTQIQFLKTTELYATQNKTFAQKIASLMSGIYHKTCRIQFCMCLKISIYQIRYRLCIK
jgi:hypothetical protein